LRSIADLSEKDDFEREYFLSFMAIALLDLIEVVYQLNSNGIKIYGLE
jgi:hypothetical protein